MALTFYRNEIINLDIRNKNLNYSKETQTFTGECSELNLCVNHKTIIKITNHNTGNVETFKHVKTDTDGEDIYGWNFKSENGFSLLIIND